jgi:hypothetical protein
MFFIKENTLVNKDECKCMWLVGELLDLNVVLERISTISSPCSFWTLFFQ